MKKVFLYLVIFWSGYLPAQITPMLSLPNGTSGISTTNNSRGVAVGSGFSTPEGRLHVLDEVDAGSVLFLEARSGEVGNQDGTFTNISPDYFIKARFDDHQMQGSGDIKFSVDAGGKIQSGFYSQSVNDQLAVRNNLGIYSSIDRIIRFDLLGGLARMTWEAPGNNFQFVNVDNNTVALQLGEDGEVGINTGTWTNDHKLQVNGGALSDLLMVQQESEWSSSDNFMKFEYTDRPIISWQSNSSQHPMEFKHGNETPLRLTPSGKVGINTGDFIGDHDLFVDGSIYIYEDDTDSSPYSLLIEGTAIAEEMFIRLKDGTWGDFVFEEDYDLMPLDELERYLDENKHLPGFKPASEIEEKGVPLGETERQLTIKVEELTLYILELKKEIDTLKQELEKE